jgi:hypothetical protein
VWKREGNNHLEDLGIDGKMLLVNWILMNRIVGGGFIWLRTGTGAGSCEHGDEHLGSIKRGEFLE